MAKKKIDTDFDEPPMEGHDVRVRRLMRQAEDMLEKGDRMQAAEKAWDAFEHQMKVLSKEKGWKYDDNPNQLLQLALEADALAQQELGEEKRKVVQMVGTAENLHDDFYPEIKPIPFLRAQIDITQELIDILHKLGENGNGSTRGGGNGGRSPRKQSRKPRKSPQMKRVEELKRRRASEAPRKSRSLQGDAPVMTQAQLDRMRPW